MASERDAEIKAISEEALDCIEKTAESAEQGLRRYRGSDVDALASVNTWNDSKEVAGIRQVGEATKATLREVAKEPVIARVTFEREDGDVDTVYVARGSAPATKFKIASYRSPLGRIAALPAGDDATLSVDGREQEIVVVDTTKLHPYRNKELWDSRNNQVDSVRFGKVTIASLRALGHLVEPRAEGDLLAELLQEDLSPHIIIGMRRDVLSRMSLRDQPILDKFQDEIFRLPLQSRLFLLGPPGTGKTTTLIRRLGQKLDRTALEQSELVIVDRIERDGAAHESSWIMFSPTELLRQYVKEAFALEGVPASNKHIRTWDKYRNVIARDYLGILRTGTGGGPFVERNDSSYLQSVCYGSGGTLWCDAFEAYLHDQLYAELQFDAESLRNSGKAELVELAEQLDNILSSLEDRFEASAAPALAALGDLVKRLIEQRTQAVERIINRTVNRLLGEDLGFLDTFAQEVARQSQIEEDETEEDDEEGDADGGEGAEGDEREPLWSRRVSRNRALAIYRQTALVAARAEAGRRRLSSSTRTGRLAAWLTSTRLPTAVDLSELAKLDAELRRLRRINTVDTLLPRSVARLYKRFRRDKEIAPVWYSGEPDRTRDICWQEIDLLILILLKSCSKILTAYRGTEHAPSSSIFARVRALYRNQVLVDEATDFSVIQLAAMRELAHPTGRSIFMCGDFNQRLTSWGVTSKKDLGWIDPSIDFRTIEIGYRQSGKLLAFAKDVAMLGGSEAQNIVLPESVDAEGVAPVSAANLDNVESTAAWLADRILEIETIVNGLPSIAVLVNEESEVEQLAGALSAELEDRNIKAVPCKDGEVLGDNRDIRVFHIKHIKGMEFEAVFFVNLDETILSQPDLFTKYLYVGATRAATYLGITFSGDVPNEVAELSPHFESCWPM